MNHGFPARLIVPGLYGYVSATKWLAAIELTRREDVDGYWIPLGWAKDAPILTQSRIDVPAQDARIPAGSTEVAGVAWAPDRGVAGVEVRVDDGPWQPARTSRPISDATWVQWAFSWDATAGRHRLEVRATDGDGDTQTEERTDVAPDGARGHHRIVGERRGRSSRDGVPGAARPTAARAGGRAEPRRVGSGCAAVTSGRRLGRPSRASARVPTPPRP